jgi:putative SOS response-associated peptidase YedK
MLYAIAMKDGALFGIAVIWEDWKEPSSGEDSHLRDHYHPSVRLRKFMTACWSILASRDYSHWLGEEPDPRGLMRQFPAELNNSEA